MKRLRVVWNVAKVLSTNPDTNDLRCFKKINICFNVAFDLLKIDKLACGYY